MSEYNSFRVHRRKKREPELRAFMWTGELEETPAWAMAYIHRTDDPSEIPVGECYIDEKRLMINHDYGWYGASPGTWLIEENYFLYRYTREEFNKVFVIVKEANRAVA